VPPPKATTREPAELPFFKRGLFMKDSSAVPSREMCQQQVRRNISALKHNLGKGHGSKLARVAFFFRIQQFREARVFLEEIEVFIIARVIAVGGAQFDGNFEIGESGIGFAR